MRSYPIASSSLEASQGREVPGTSPGPRRLPRVLSAMEMTPLGFHMGRSIIITHSSQSANSRLLRLTLILFVLSSWLPACNQVSAPITTVTGPLHPVKQSHSREHPPNPY